MKTLNYPTGFTTLAWENLLEQAIDSISLEDIIYRKNRINSSFTISAGLYGYKIDIKFPDCHCPGIKPPGWVCPINNDRGLFSGDNCRFQWQDGMFCNERSEAELDALGSDTDCDLCIHTGRSKRYSNFNKIIWTITPIKWYIKEFKTKSRGPRKHLGTGFPLNAPYHKKIDIINQSNNIFSMDN